MPTHSRVPARIAAVLALAAAVVALLVIISSNGDTDPGNQGATKATSQQSTERKPRPRRAAYVVKDGDTLLGIASKTNVDIDRLEQLNPEIDPQRLIAGQRIKLR